MHATEKNQAWLRDYYRHIDAMDTDAYMAMFAEDARMIFANADPLEGRDAIREALTGLLGSVDGIRHVLHDAWQLEDDLVAFECDVVYDRKDGKQVTIRGGCFFVLGEDGLCREQRITVDTTPVFAP
jgi:ketosteroid isomerase-like protein